uniref:Protein Ycf2 n=1 Tax=Callitris pyramidalis TaxID=214228 RepID=A0A8F8SUM1_9CONI|nr:hypothetical protein RF2 [Callitris pyramidalis]
MDKEKKLYFDDLSQEETDDLSQEEIFSLRKNLEEKIFSLRKNLEEDDDLSQEEEDSLRKNIERLLRKMNREDENPCPTYPNRDLLEEIFLLKEKNPDPSRKMQERIWFFSIQSKFKRKVMSIFFPWNESNLVRLLSQIFSGRESVLKLFDFRILSTLLIRDIRIFILKNQIKKAVMLIILPLVVFFLAARKFTDQGEQSYNLTKILPPVQDDFVTRARKKNVLLVPHLFMSLRKDKRRYQRCLLNPKEHFWLSSSNTNLNLQHFMLESKKQKTISEGSLLEKESNGLEWEIDSSFDDSSFDSIQNEYWEKQPENLYELSESLSIFRNKLFEELENKVEQQEKMFEEESNQAKEYFSFSDCQGFFDNLLMEELENRSINSINKASEKLLLFKERQDAFQYFKKLEKNKIVDLWKVKTFLKNPSVNYDISDPFWNIRQDINQFNCIRFININKNLSSISSSYDQNKEQYDDFQFKKFVFKITNQFTLSITKPNQSSSNDEIALEMDYCINELHSLNQTLLNSFFNKKTLLNSFFNKKTLLNSFFNKKTLLNSFFNKKTLLNSFFNKRNEYFIDFVAFLWNTSDSFNKEWKRALNKYSIVFHEYSVELQKVLNKNRYYLEFIFFIKTLSHTLHNVIQDAITHHSSSWTICIKTLSRTLHNVIQDTITHHSSSWIICQKEWLNHSIFHGSKDRNLNKNNTFVLQIATQSNFFINLINKSRSNAGDPNLESSQTIAPLVLNEKKSIIQLIIDAFDNGKNDMELLNNADFSTCLSAIFDDQDNWLNPLKLSNQNSLRTSFYKANTFEFLDYLHCPRFFYQKRLSSYMERIHIKNKNVAYGQLLNLVPIYNNLFSLSIGEMRTVYSEKETISLIKSQVNILLDKYLRDQVLIRDLDKSSNLVNKLNSIFQKNVDFFIEDIYRTPLINPQVIPKIVNLDKNSCYPFLSSSDSEEKTFNQNSKNSLNSDIDLIQTQSYQEDLLSEIVSEIVSEISLRKKKLEESRLPKIRKNLIAGVFDLGGDYFNIEDIYIRDDFFHSPEFIDLKPIGDFIEFKTIGDFFNKEKLKFFFARLKVSFKTEKIKRNKNILFEKWGLFQTYRSWLWLLTSAGWKYTKNMFLAIFPEIPINSNDQLLSIPHNFYAIGLECIQNWNHNLKILRSLYHQFWELLKWEIRNKIDQIRKKIFSIWNHQILPIWYDQILPFILSRRIIAGLLKIINEILLETQLERREISFEKPKDRKNCKDYDLVFINILIGFLFSGYYVILVMFIQFLSDVYTIQELDFCSERLEEMIEYFEKRREKYNNLYFKYSHLKNKINWNGILVTLVDYMDNDYVMLEPEDIGLRELLEFWYEPPIKWVLVPSFFYNLHGLVLDPFNSLASRKKSISHKRFSYCKYYSYVQKLLYESGEDDFFLKEKRLFLIKEKILQFESKLTPPIGFFHDEIQKKEQPGLLYFRYLAEFIQRGHRTGFKSELRDAMSGKEGNLKWTEIMIFNLFYQKIFSEPSRSFLNDPARYNFLVGSFSNRILLLGPKETGRSYLVKSLAADSYLPLIRISLKSFFQTDKKLMTRCEAEHTSSAKQSYLEQENILMDFGFEGRLPEVKAEGGEAADTYNFKPHKVFEEDPAGYSTVCRKYFQFVVALTLANIMSPCIIWIPDIHQMSIYPNSRIIIDTFFRKDLNTVEKKARDLLDPNVVLIASTDCPSKVDPSLMALLTPQRFNQFIFTRKWSIQYREKKFPLLLRNKGLYLKKEWNCYHEFGFNTKDFNMRDLSRLVDKIFLISMSQNTSTVDNDTIDLILYRLNWCPCNYNLQFSEFCQGLPYKIGKAIIQNKLTCLKNSIGFSLDALNIRANYLHQWYLEPSIVGAAAKEFTVFYHILGCLAGSVAQDCFFLSESNKENWSRPFDLFIQNDFILASSLLQGILEEFPSLAIYKDNSDYIIAPQFKKDTMQKGLSDILDKFFLSKELDINQFHSYFFGDTEEEGNIIKNDPMLSRLGFIRSNRFEHIKDIRDNPLLDYFSRFERLKEEPILSSLYWDNFLSDHTYIRHDLYACRGENMRERKKKALWEAKLLYKKLQRIGICKFEETDEDEDEGEDKEHPIEYKPINLQILHKFGQIYIWDPVDICLINKHFSIEPIALFESKELVKNIYLTYSDPREDSKLNFRDKEIKWKHFKRRKKVRRIALGIKIQTNDEDDLPLKNQKERMESFQEFKHFEEIGIRLRRVSPHYKTSVSDAWLREKTRDDRYKFKDYLKKGERENRDLLSHESLIYKTLFESYEYLANLFFSNSMLFKQMIDTLLKTKWLSATAIDCLLAEGLNKKT